MIIDAAGNPSVSLDWVTLHVPGGSAPVDMSALPSAPELGVVALCRFPFGWERTQTGYYDIHEELVYLVGEMTVMSHELTGQLATSFHPGDHVIRPRHQLRTGNCTVTGCLTLAWVERRGIYTEAQTHGPEFRHQPDHPAVFTITRTVRDDFNISWPGGSLRLVSA